MPKTSKTIPVALEIGQKRIFAVALDWPGWARSGREEQSALASLLAYAPRYAQAIERAKLDFRTPQRMDEFDVIERMPGNATTDFGAPDGVPSIDLAPVDAETLARFQAILAASWQALRRTHDSAIGKVLRKGPRGGGRELTGVVGHVVDAHASYLRNINYRAKRDEADDISTVLEKMQDATQEALSIAVTEGLPAHGPRGGKFWPVRYFVRRAAWHILDHVWEIEDRLHA
jgi:hypothetical protein